MKFKLGNKKWLEVSGGLPLKKRQRRNAIVKNGKRDSQLTGQQAMTSEG